MLLRSQLVLPNIPVRLGAEHGSRGGLTPPVDPYKETLRLYHIHEKDEKDDGGLSSQRRRGTRRAGGGQKLRVSEARAHVKAILAENTVDALVQDMRLTRMDWRVQRWNELKRVYYSVFVTRKGHCGRTVREAFEHHLSGQDPAIDVGDFEHVLTENFGITEESDIKSLAADRLFQTFCTADATFAVDWREFVCCLRVLEKPLHPDGAFGHLMFCFTTFDLHGVGLSVANVRTILHQAIQTDAEAEISAGEMFDSRLDLRFGHKSLCVEAFKSLVSRHEFADFLLAEPEVVRAFGEICWRRLDSNMHCIVYKANIASSQAVIDRAVQRVNLEKALVFFELGTKNRIFDKIKRYAVLRRSIYRGEQHFKWKRVRVAVRQWEEWNEISRINKVALVKGTNNANRICVKHVFRAWVIAYRTKQQLERAAELRAVKYYPPPIKLKCFRAIAANRIEEQRLAREALQKARANNRRQTLRRTFRDWHFHIRTEVSNREAAKAQKALFESLSKAEREAAEKAEQDRLEYLRMKESQEHADSERDAYEAMMKHQEFTVMNRKRLDKQEAERLAHKKALADRWDAQHDDFWADMKERSMAQARKDAAKWVMTPEGVAMVKEEAQWIYEEDPNDAAKRAKQGEGVEGSEWKLLLDEGGGVFAKAFFFNGYSKFYCKDLKIKNCKVIAEANLIAVRALQIRDEMMKLVSREGNDRERNAAAAMLQNVFRCRKTRKVIKSMLQHIYVERVHPVTFRPSYYNTHVRKLFDQKPTLIHDVHINRESKTWVLCRTEDSNEPYYFNQETEETAWTTPDHFILCTRCKVEPTTRRCRHDGRRYCVPCMCESIANKEHLNEDGTDHDFARAPPVAVRCIVCTHTMAAVYCHECNDDAFCDSCYAQVHTHPPRNTHRGRVCIPPNYDEVPFQHGQVY